MLHDGLEMHGIRKVASEARLIEEHHESMHALLDRLDDIVLKRFTARKPLSGQQLKFIYEECRRLFGESVTLIECEFRERPATRIHPKGEAYEAFYVAARKMDCEVPGFESRLYQLFTFRMFATRKVVRFELDHLPVAFGYHAAVRVMGRMKEIDKAFGRIATELADWTVFLKHAEYAAEKRIDGYMAAPMMDGSGGLMGSYADKAYGTRVEREHTRFTTRTKVRNPEPEDSRLFVARTFINRELLRPAQRYAMNLIGEWRERHCVEYGKSRDGHVRPECLDDPADIELGAACVSALDDVLSDQVLLRAINPDITVNRHRDEDDRLPAGRWSPQVSIGDGTVN